MRTVVCVRTLLLKADLVKHGPRIHVEKAMYFGRLEKLGSWIRRINMAINEVSYSTFDDSKLNLRSLNLRQDGDGYFLIFRILDCI